MMVGSSKGSVNLPLVQSDPEHAFRLLAGSSGFSVGAIAGNGGESGGKSCADVVEKSAIRNNPDATTTPVVLSRRMVGSLSLRRSGDATTTSGCRRFVQSRSAETSSALVFRARQYSALKKW